LEGSEEICVKFFVFRSCGIFRGFAIFQEEEDQKVLKLFLAYSMSLTRKNNRSFKKLKNLEGKLQFKKIRIAVLNLFPFLRLLNEKTNINDH